MAIQTMTNAEIKERLRDYQIPVVGSLIRGFKSHSFMLDASSMGVGKSFSSIATVLATGSAPLVICKKAGITHWKRVWNEHFGISEELPVVNYEALRYGNTPFGKWVEEKVGRRTKEFFRFNQWPNMMILWDEVHHSRGATSQNGDMLMACHTQQIKSLGISATCANSPAHLKSLGALLGLHNGNNFFEFKLKHGYQKTRFGWKWQCGMMDKELSMFSHWDNGKKKFKPRPEGQEELKRRQGVIMQRIHQRIFGEGRGVRLRKEEIPDFPKLTVIPYTVDFKESTPAIREAYRQMKVKLASEEGKRHAMAIRMDTAQTVELLKIKHLKEDIDQSLEEGNSVCIFCNFNRSVDLMAEMFGTTCIVRGGQTATERQLNIDRFQANLERLIILNNAAGGESIGLHDLFGGYPRVSFIFPSTFAEAMAQCSGRTPRNGSLSPSIVMFPFALDTQEVAVMELVRTKWDNIHHFNDGEILAALAA